MTNRPVNDQLYRFDLKYRTSVHVAKHVSGWLDDDKTTTARTDHEITALFDFSTRVSDSSYCTSFRHGDMATMGDVDDP